MRMTIRAKRVPKDAEIEELVRRQADLGLDRFNQQLSEVAVLLEDLNGPRGGEDKACRVTASTPQGERYYGSAEHASLEGAVVLAFRKLSRNLARRPKSPRPRAPLSPEPELL